MVQSSAPTREKVIIKNVEYEVCECCNKPKRGTGKSLGAVSMWVVKNYVKSGRIVNFVDQWRILCEACGFEHIETIIAWQTEDKGTNYDLDGGKKKRTIKRASFFRILYEKKHPENSIDAEIVLVVRKHL